MIEKLAAEREEVGAGRGAADFMQELTARLNAEADEVHILFMLLICADSPDARRADGFVKRVHILEHIAAGRAEDGGAATLFANLTEEPGIADDAAADHEPARAGEREDFAGFVGGIDVAVRQDRARA